MHGASVWAIEGDAYPDDVYAIGPIIDKLCSVAVSLSWATAVVHPDGEGSSSSSAVIIVWEG